MPVIGFITIAERRKSFPSLPGEISFRCKIVRKTFPIEIETYHQGQAFITGYLANNSMYEERGLSDQI
jgi:hypothetical protein